MAKISNLIRGNVAEALDECGIYYDPKLEKELLNYALKLSTQKQFANLDGKIYERFCNRLIDFIVKRNK